jgi:hypothetical protein
MKHKHADLIHFWADGAQIQSRNDISGCWEDNRLPMWAQDTMYRIKPEPKPNVVEKYFLGIASLTSCRVFFRPKEYISVLFQRP